MTANKSGGGGGGGGGGNINCNCRGCYCYYCCLDSHPTSSHKSSDQTAVRIMRKCTKCNKKQKYSDASCDKLVWVIFMGFVGGMVLAVGIVVY